MKHRKLFALTITMAAAGLLVSLPLQAGEKHAEKGHDKHSHAKAEDGCCGGCGGQAASEKLEADANAKEPMPVVVHREGGLAPLFNLKDQHGKTVSLADYDGKIVVLEWTNPECPFVKAHYADDVRTMPRMAEKYGKQGVVWLAINSTHWWDVKQNGQWHEKKELGYPLLADPTGEAGKAYGAKTTPHMFVIDTKGKIAYQGAIDDNPLGKKDRTHNHVGKALDRLLADKDVEAAKTKPYGCSVKYAPESQIPAVTLKDQAGSDVDLRKSEGKITVLEFVNPDCPFVKRHYRQGTMKKLAGKYEDKDVRWLAVNTTHYFNVEKNKSFHDAHDLPYPVLDDSEGKVGKALGAKTTPHMFVFDKNGQLVYHGAIDSSPRGKGKDVTNHVDEALSSLVEGKAPETAETKPYGCSVKYKPDKSK